MRPFKFRAYDSIAGVFSDSVDVVNPCWPEKCHQVVQSFDDYANITIMQYSGFNDETGVEIYEDDIVVIEGEEKPFIAGFNTDRGMFVLSRLNKPEYLENVLKYRNPDEYIWAEGARVVGNIYENSELLEEKL